VFKVVEKRNGTFYTDPVSHRNVSNLPSGPFESHCWSVSHRIHSRRITSRLPLRIAAHGRMSDIFDELPTSYLALRSLAHPPVTASNELLYGPEQSPPVPGSLVPWPFGPAPVPPLSPETRSPGAPSRVHY
jgi:hypothetical protein